VKKSLSDRLFKNSKDKEQSNNWKIFNSLPSSSTDFMREHVCRKWALRSGSLHESTLHHSPVSSWEISPVLARLLTLRGFGNEKSLREYLCPGLSLLKPLEQWPGLLDGASRLAEALQSAGPLVVWGDYDVDGITATALVREFLAQRGVRVGHYLPQRGEGYGLHVTGIEALHEQGYKILLTVDCGTTAIDAVARAKELGFFVVVTDHHTPGPHLPPADVLLNPLVLNWPFEDLAGVGVVFFLMAALNRMLPGEPLDIRDFLDLVALGTIADVVGLRDQNRILVKNGQLLLKKTRRPGIRALKSVCGIDEDKPVGAGAVGFQLAPRLNAAGRLDDPNLALALLLSDSEKEAGRLARKLNDLNARRRSEELRITAEAKTQAQVQIASGRAGLVLYGEDWHQGIIGIVASRIVDEFHFPTLVVTRQDGGLKGSGRSAGDFHLVQGLKACAHVLSDFGGHRNAAGFSLPPQNLEALQTQFSQAVLNQLGGPPQPGDLLVDMSLGLEEITPALLDEIEMMQPFGPDNPRPVFLSDWLEVRTCRLLGRQGLHLGLVLRDPKCGVSMQARLWRARSCWTERDLSGSEMRVAFTPGKSEYQGMMTMQLTIRDILAVRQN
jgi:single-stranded-DNA-specific exonuclease